MGLLIPATIPQVIVEVLKGVDIGLKRPATIPLVIVDQHFMLTGEVGICIRPDTLPLITQVAVVYFKVSHFILFLLTKMFINIRE